jgi:hypothetical protein
MTEYLVRFMVGGLVVSAFALIGDILRPKSFAGLFGAAPSVALVTLALAIWQHGAGYAATESRSMAVGAVALGIYSWLVCQALIRFERSALMTTSIAFVAWLAVALGLQQLLPG